MVFAMHEVIHSTHPSAICWKVESTAKYCIENSNVAVRYTHTQFGHQRHLVRLEETRGTNRSAPLAEPRYLRSRD